MGKTRLLTEFCRSLAGQPVTVAVGQCLAYGRTTPYLPVRDMLRQLCGMEEAEAAAHTPAVLQWLQASGITSAADGALLGQLLDLPEPPELLAAVPPQARQARTFALLRHLILHEAQRQPLVVVVENLHWSDATSEAWLTSLVEQLVGAAVLLLVTYRPGYQPPWGMHSVATHVALPPLRARDSRTVVQAVVRTTPLPERLLQEIMAHAGGNPFFLEELAWHAREQTPLATSGAVPETVHAVLAARMDQLPPAAKRLLQTAAVVGMEVSFPLLQTLTEQPAERLHQSLAQLQAAEFLYETFLLPDLGYAFKHALTQEVAYQSLLTSTRRQAHQQVARVLEAQFPDIAVTRPEWLAHHYMEGGLQAQAIPYWHSAGQRAMARSAYAEAHQHLTMGLDLLATLPETPARAQQELDLQVALGISLSAIKGMAAPEVKAVYTRARELCQQVSGQETFQLFSVLSGLWRFYLVGAEHQVARELAEQLLTLAQRTKDPALLIGAHQSLAVSSFHLGELLAARAHLE
jgi:predicted ATPase